MRVCHHVLAAALGAMLACGGAATGLARATPAQGGAPAAGLAAGAPSLASRDAACGTGNGRPVQANPLFAVTDDLGQTVQLGAPARRLLTLAPHAAELVFAAGGEDYIVGTVNYSDYPPAAQALPRVGDAWQINPESVLLLQPDLVVAWQQGPVAALQPVLTAACIPTFFSAPARLEDIAVNIEKLGMLMGSSPIARKAAETFRHRLATLEARYAGLEPISVFIQAGSQPLYTLTDKHILGDALRICGARNVFGDAGPASPMVEIEAVIAAAPQAILSAAGPGYPDPHQEWQRYAAALAAVENGHLFVLDADALYRPGPRLLDATQKLCALIDTVRNEPGR